MTRTTWATSFWTSFYSSLWLIFFRFETLIESSIVVLGFVSIFHFTEINYLYQKLYGRIDLYSHFYSLKISFYNYILNLRRQSNYLMANYHQGFSTTKWKRWIFPSVGADGKQNDWFHCRNSWNIIPKYKLLQNPTSECQNGVILQQAFD